MDALSQALMQRRGKSIDPSMLKAEDESVPEVQPLPSKEVQKTQPGAPADPHAGHLDEHTQVVGETQPVQDDPEMMDAVSGNASQSDYDDLKGIAPRSLGERAKMAALNKKYRAKA